MKTFTKAAAVHNFETILDQITQEPIEICTTEKPSVVMISVEEYKKLESTHLKRHRLTDQPSNE